MARSRPAETRSETRRPRRARVAGLIAATMAASAATLLASGQQASAGIVPTVPLATSANYSVLASSTVTNTNPSVIGQSVGLSPGSSITGFPPGVVLPPATIQGPDAVTLQAQQDLTTAYTNAAGRGVEFTQTNPDLVGQTLVPGVYAATAKAPLGLSGQLVLDGQGNASAVFIFQTDSTLITSTGSSIVLINGASECNVFWQVGSSATLGSGSEFVGNILALTSITVESGVTVHGRALAQTGAVTLDNDVFTQPSCSPSTNTTPTTTTTPATTTPATTTPATTTPATTTPATTVLGTTTAAPPATSGGSPTSNVTEAAQATTTAPAGTSPAPPNIANTTTPMSITHVAGTNATTTSIAPLSLAERALPKTGTSTVRTLMIAISAVVTGAAALLVARRRIPR